MDLEQAKKDSRTGAHVAFFMAVVLLAIVSYFLYFSGDASSSPAGRFYGDPVNYFDVVLLVIVGIGLLRYSRTAAVLLFLVITLSAIVKFSELGQTSGVVMVLVFLFYAGKAIRGTFAYHRISREEDPNYRSPIKWLYYAAGIPVALVFGVLLGLGILMEMGVMPSIEVLPGDEVKSSDKAMLQEKGILIKDERIDWFYSEGFFSIMEGGSILADKRLISYTMVGDKLDIASLKVEDITEIVQIVKGDTFTDTIIEAYNKEGDGVLLVLSVENGGDVKFIDELLERTQLTLIEPPPEETLEDVTPANVQPAKLSE